MRILGTSPATNQTKFMDALGLAAVCAKMFDRVHSSIRHAHQLPPGRRGSYCQTSWFCCRLSRSNFKKSSEKREFAILWTRGSLKGVFKNRFGKKDHIWYFLGNTTLTQLQNQTLRNASYTMFHTMVSALSYLEGTHLYTCALDWRSLYSVHDVD